MRGALSVKCFSTTAPNPFLHPNLLRPAASDCPQELTTVDKACSNVDSTDDTDCYEVNGDKISQQSKRDVGIMLEVIVTYTNKCA